LVCYGFGGKTKEIYKSLSDQHIMKRKENLLFICHRIPFPPNKGDKIRSFNFLKYFAEFYNVHLAFLVDDPKDLKHLNELSAYAETIFFETISPGRKKIVSLVKAVLQKNTVSVQYFYSSCLQQNIDNFIQENPIDKVFCFSSPTAEYIFQSNHRAQIQFHAQKTMDLIDVDSRKWSQYAERCSVVFKWLYRREARLLLRYEEKIIDFFDQTLLVSNPEKNILQNHTKSARLHAVSNGVDIDFFSPDQGVDLKNTAPTLVFVGAMDYLPNVEGIGWFVEQILPMVQEAIPDIHLQIVGSKPTKEVLALQRMDNILVTGFVEDVRDYLLSADICIVPLKIARGIQNKVLEAMAMGKPVVCTEEALTGIDAEPGECVLVENDPGLFAKAVIRLINDPNLKKDLGEKARERMVNEYAWSNKLKQLRRIMTGNKRDE